MHEQNSKAKIVTCPTPVFAVILAGQSYLSWQACYCCAEPAAAVAAAAAAAAAAVVAAAAAGQWTAQADSAC